MYIYNPVLLRRTFPLGAQLAWCECWHLHEIATANIVWCMAYTRGVGWGSHIAQKSCNSIAIV